jgi:hypothetical protein
MRTAPVSVAHRHGCRPPLRHRATSSPDGKPSHLTGVVVFWLISLYALSSAISALQIPMTTLGPRSVFRKQIRPRTPVGVPFTTDVRDRINIVAVRGGPDASNMPLFVEHTQCRHDGDRALVLDLSELVFLGGGGVAALTTVNRQRDDAALPWAMVPGRPIIRLLGIADPHHLPPTAESVTAAQNSCAEPQRTPPTPQRVTAGAMS